MPLGFTTRCAGGTYESCTAYGFVDGTDNVVYALEWVAPAFVDFLRGVPLRAIDRATARWSAFLPPALEVLNVPRIIGGALRRFDVPGGFPTGPKTLFCFWWSVWLLPLYTIIVVLGVTVFLLALFFIGFALFSLLWLLVLIFALPLRTIARARTTYNGEDIDVVRNDGQRVERTALRNTVALRGTPVPAGSAMVLRHAGAAQLRQRRVR